MLKAHLARMVRGGGGSTPLPFRVGVFGSSQGLLGYFTAVCVLVEFYCAMHGGCASCSVDDPAGGGKSAIPNTGLGLADLAVKVDGYEVMPLLFDKSVQVAAQLRAPGAAVEYHLQDMLTADVTGLDVVVLTSLCWDASTRTAVARKLHRELQPGVLVVEYTADLFKAAGVDADSVTIGPAPTSADVPAAGVSPTPPAPGGAGVLFKLHSILQGECTWNREQKLFLFHAV
jgi:hypothetical protein